MMVERAMLEERSMGLTGCLGVVHFGQSSDGGEMSLDRWRRQRHSVEGLMTITKSKNSKNYE